MFIFLAIAAAVVLTWGCTAAAAVAFIMGCTLNWEAEATAAGSQFADWELN